MNTLFKTLASATLAVAGCAMAGQASAPINVLHKGASWKSDLKACQETVASNFVSSTVAESRSTTAVCEVNDNSIACRDVRPSVEAPNLSRKSSPEDDAQNRRSMLAHCLGDKGWRDR
jgi:hypothetical protein